MKRLIYLILKRFDYIFLCGHGKRTTFICIYAFSKKHAERRVRKKHKYYDYYRLEGEHENV